MNFFFENRRIERILSILIISYGIFLFLDRLDIFVQYCLYYGLTTGYGLMDFEYHGRIVSNLTIGIGVFFALFSRRIVSWVGYFSTEGKPRRLRAWSAREIVAAILVLYAFNDLLTYCFPQFTSTVYCFLADTLSTYRTTTIADMLTSLRRMAGYAAVDILILFYARTLVGCLLRRIETPLTRKLR